MPETVRRTPKSVAIFLLVAGALGLLAAFELSVEKVLTAADANHVPSCNVGVLVGCSKNLASAQGAIFGFPNPFIGMMAWPVVIVIAVALLGKVRFPKWFWIGFNIGVTGALIFVIWLIAQSIYVLDVLCPWCMLTWAVTIPTFWVVTLYNIKSGNFGNNRLRHIAAAWFGWIPLITIICYGIVIIVAQIQIDAIPRIILDFQNL